MPPLCPGPAEPSSPQEPFRACWGHCRIKTACAATPCTEIVRYSRENDRGIGVRWAKCARWQSVPPPPLSLPAVLPRSNTPTRCSGPHNANRRLSLGRLCGCIGAPWPATSVLPRPHHRKGEKPGHMGRVSPLVNGTLLGQDRLRSPYSNASATSLRSSTMGRCCGQARSQARHPMQSLALP